MRRPSEEKGSLRHDCGINQSAGERRRSRPSSAWGSDLDGRSKNQVRPKGQQERGDGRSSRPADAHPRDVHDSRHRDKRQPSDQALIDLELQFSNLQKSYEDLQHENDGVWTRERELEDDKADLIDKLSRAQAEVRELNETLDLL